MLNEERVILMTRMAAYEKGEGRENVKIGNYFRSDYLAIQLLKAVVCAALVFVLVFGFYILYHFENFMEEIYDMDLIAFAQNVLIYFGATIVGYGVATYFACSWKYAQAKKSLKCYYHNLKKLNSLYQDGQ